MNELTIQYMDENYYTDGLSNSGKELGALLIKAFKPLSSGERRILSNNAYMVGLQMKIELGDEKYKYIQKTFKEPDWKEAWNLFNQFNE